MLSSRRGVLALVAALPGVAVTACAPSPVVTGGPSAPYSPTPTEPVQSPGIERAAAWTTQLVSVVAAAPEETAQWAAAVTSQLRAHLERLDAADPLAPGGEAVFTPSPAPPTDPTGFEDDLDALLDDGPAMFRELVAEAGSQPMRLLHASLAASAAGLRNRALLPVPGDGVPIRFPETSLDASLLVALSHCWALLHGLEVALGRLPEGTTHDVARRRLAQARELRNELRAGVEGESPAQELSYEMPNAMREPEEIRTALATLEQRLLDALARLVASGAEGDQWFDALLLQVPHVQAWGGRLPHWPGWAQV